VLPCGAMSARRPRERGSFYLWTAVVLVAAVVLVVISWHARGGTPDPTEARAGHRLGSATVVIDSAILVFREGLETILVLAAITASFLGANRVYRRPVAAGSGLALGGGVLTWFGVVWLIGRFHGSELSIQAATGIPALIVLLIVMNWFFHKVYWTGWIAAHNRRRRELQGTPGGHRRLLLGLALLGFTAVYREGFEIVLFLQNLRLTAGSTTVLEGVAVGLALTVAVGAATFFFQHRLPYRRMLVATGVLLGFVLLVMVGESVQELQLAGWLPTHALGVTFPGWMGLWLAFFPTVEGVVAQILAVSLVAGSYFLAEEIRVRRPRRRAAALAATAHT